ncbi:hypothetical protein F5Y10DRAFT_273929 [Nemania abortiva]|nr:hypothetical protein F5Y10DRAFT_273929 [Nemania abortiva]
MCVSVDGIIVLNQDGRQFDGVRDSLETPRDVAPAVGDRTEALLNGSIRTGASIIEALALCARAVSVSRPVICGLGPRAKRALCMYSLLAAGIPKLFLFIGNSHPVDFPDISFGSATARMAQKIRNVMVIGVGLTIFSIPVTYK